MHPNQNQTYATPNHCPELTGLSVKFIRRGLKEGWIPHIRNGNRFLVNVPALLEILDQASRQEAKSAGRTSR